jgi:hypothetical protein
MTHTFWKLSRSVSFRLRILAIVTDHSGDRDRFAAV